MLFMALLTGPQLPRHSWALVANGLASPHVPSRGAKRGGGTLPRGAWCAWQPGPSLTSIFLVTSALRLCPSTALGRVQTAPSPKPCGWHGSFPADVLLRRRDANLENPPSSPRCCDRTAVYAIAWPLRVFFPGRDGEKGFCRGAMARTWWLRDRLWPARCWHSAGSCPQPSSPLRSPGASRPQLSSDVLQGLVPARFGHWGKQALPAGRARKFSVTSE